MSNHILVKQKEYKMAVFCAFSLLVFAFIMWQWVRTVRELDSLAAGVGRYQFLKPHTDGEDLNGANELKDQRGVIKKQ
ncbi:MAG TPA: hypothetical protein VJB56_01785 [Candidatus Paceibacterota bacterium]